MTVYGPIITPLDVEDALRSTLQAFINQYLGAIERHDSVFAVNEIPRPTRWEVVSDVSSLNAWPARDLPAMIVEAATEAADPSISGDGDVTSQMAFTVYTLHRGDARERDRIRRMVILTAVAARLILFQQGALGGIAQRCIPGRISPDTVKPSEPTTLSGAVFPVVVVVPGVANTHVGPDTPDPPDQPPPETDPDDPLHTSTHIHVTELPSDQE